MPRSSLLTLSSVCIICSRMVDKKQQTWTAPSWSRGFWTKLKMSFSQLIHRHIASVSGVNVLKYDTYHWLITEVLWLRVFAPPRYDTDKHYFWNQEGCEKTAPVCLCSRCRIWQIEVGVRKVSRHGGVFMATPWNDCMCVLITVSLEEEWVSLLYLTTGTRTSSLKQDTGYNACVISK